MPYDLSDLKLVRIFLGRINHNLRNNLSVSLAVLNDLVEGYELSTDEIEDAKKSIEQALSLLKFFEPIINPWEKRVGQINLSKLIARQIEENGLKEFFQSELKDREAIILADEKTLIYSLKYFFLYLNSKLSSFLRNNQSLNIIFSKADKAFTLSAKLSASFLNKEKLIAADLTGPMLFLQTDFSTEALGLIFVQNLMKENNLGELKLSYLEKEDLILMELICYY